jgi:hypothetical protein
MTLAQFRDLSFGAIDKSATQIPSGALMEHSLFGWDKNRWKTGSGDTLRGAKEWFLLYSTLYEAKVNANGTLAHPDTLYNAGKAQLSETLMPMLLLQRGIIP